MLSGMLAGVPRQGGATWSVLQYLLGLRRLGHDVLFVEPISAGGRALSTTPAMAYLAAVVERFGLAGRAAVIEPTTHETAGIERGVLGRFACDADLLINLSGTLAEPELTDPIPVRAFVDLDPGFTQLWNAVEGIDLGFDLHNRFVTIGRGLGAPGSLVPDCGREWIETPQPVVLERWPVATEPVDERLTSIGHWRSYGSIEHAGILFGQRAHALRPLFDLPDRLSVPTCLALGIHPDERADLEALDRHGWRLEDPDTMAGTPERYEAFVRNSWAELGIPKSGYVAAACGWFSDRSACYLASGRPVIALDTGFSNWLPAGEGLLAFRTADEAATAVEAVRADYPGHRRAARAIAEEVLDSDRVLSGLLACL